MNINLFRNSSPPAIAYLCENSLQLSVFQDGEFLLEKYHLRYNELSSDIDISLDLSAKSKVIIIVADELTLYSQKTLPAKLTEQEVTELVAAQISQQQADSVIQTYYDYFLLQELENSAVYGLFEVRQDKLDRIIQLFETVDSKVSLLIPEVIVIINQIIYSQAGHFDDYFLVIGLSRAVFVVQIDNLSLVDINQIHTNQNKFDSAIYVDIDVYLSEVEANRAILVGLDLIEFKNRSHYCKDQSIELESINVNRDPGSQSMHWMKEQYGRYQSIAMA